MYLRKLNKMYLSIKTQKYTQRLMIYSIIIFYLLKTLLFNILWYKHQQLKSQNSSLLYEYNIVSNYG